MNPLKAPKLFVLPVGSNGSIVIIVPHPSMLEAPLPHVTLLPTRRAVGQDAQRMNKPVGSHVEIVAASSPWSGKHWWNTRGYSGTDLVISAVPPP